MSQICECGSKMIYDGDCYGPLYHCPKCDVCDCGTIIEHGTTQCGACKAGIPDGIYIY